MTVVDPKVRLLLEQLTLKLRKQRQQLLETDEKQHEPIAIVGMG